VNQLKQQLQSSSQINRYIHMAVMQYDLIMFMQCMIFRLHLVHYQGFLNTLLACPRKISPNNWRKQVKNFEHVSVGKTQKHMHTQTI
jgi:hypothetical protein